MSPEAFQVMDRRQAVMLFMAMFGLLALPESDAEADELDPDFEEFGPSDCRNVKAFPNCPDRPYSYRGVFSGHDGDLEANAEMSIEESRIVIRSMFGEPVVINADCNGSIDFVDRLAKELDAMATTREEREAEKAAFIRDVVSDYEAQALVDRTLPPCVTQDFDGHFFAFGSSREAHGKLRIAHEREGVRIRFGELNEDPKTFDLVTEFVVPHPEGRDFLVSLSQYSDAQFEQHVAKFLAKPWMITCRDCKGVLTRTRTCTSCYGNYGGIV